MEIRSANLEDSEILAQFILNIAYETEGVNLDFQVVLRGISYLYGQPSKGKYYVAEINNEIAGCLMVTSQWVDFKAIYYYYIVSAYTKIEYRGRGVFKGLYSHVVELLKADAGCLRIYAENNNEKAINAYKKVGMSQVDDKILAIDFVFK